MAKTTKFAINHDLMKRQVCMSENADARWVVLPKKGKLPVLANSVEMRWYLWGSLNTNINTLLGGLPQEFQPEGSSGNTIPPGKAPHSTRVRLSTDELKALIRRSLINIERFQRLADQPLVTPKDYREMIEDMNKLWRRQQSILRVVWVALPNGAKPDGSETGKP